MRWKILLISLFLVSIVFASPTQEIISKANEFRIDLIRYDPSPVQPGKITDVWFEVTNLGEEADLEVSLAAPFPFTVLSDKPLNFKNFKTGQKVPFKFTISTNKDVQDGEYSLSLEYYSEKIEMRASEDFDVEVKRVNRFISATNVDVTSVSAKKNKIAPGEVAEVGINIKNLGEYLMKDVSVKMGIGTAPFAPLGSTLEKKIKQIKSGENINVDFDLIALPNAEANVYTLSLNTTYYDELGNKFTKDDSIGLIIGSEPKIHVEVKRNEIYNKKESGEVIVNFVNVGLTNIKFLKVQLEGTKKELDIFGYNLFSKELYEILSEDDLYLGDVESDDDESASFRLKLKTSDKRIYLPFVISYMDASNEEYVERVYAELNIHSKEDMGVSESSSFGIMIVIILFVVFYFSYRRWKKKTKRKGLIVYVKFLLGGLNATLRKND